MHFLHLMVFEDNKIGRHHYPVLIHKLHQTHQNEKNPYIFNVVVPSIPGFAWSEVSLQGTSRVGLGPVQVAVIMRNLMVHLGYQKFFIHGGDFGSLIDSHIATLFPENVLGYHSNFCTVFTGRSLMKGMLNALQPNFLSRHGFDAQFFPRWKVIEHLLEGTGYYYLQATKPDTIATVLNDNPVGLVAYILDIWCSLTNKNYRDKSIGGLETRFKLDTLLDNVMIYYLTNSITTSTRRLGETHSEAQRELHMDNVPTDVPTDCAHFKNDLIHFHDYQLKDKYRNLIHSTYYKEGEHFIALEMSKLLHLDFIQFVGGICNKISPKFLRHLLV